MPLRWAIVGAGRCGLQLARAMTGAGLPPLAIAVRSARGRARARRLLPGVDAVLSPRPLPAIDAVLVAVQDDAIEECAVAIGPRLGATTKVALHTAGLLPGSALAPLRARGIAVGSFHPLVVFPSPGGPLVPLDLALAAVEGEERAVRAGLALARALGMRGRRIAAADKPRYHVAAAIAANLTHVLVAEARAELQAAGFSRSEAAAALAPLVGASVAGALASRNLERLTGPLVRGDARTVAAHLATLDASAARAYRAVAALARDRLRSGTTAKPRSGKALRALTAKHACDSVPADGGN